MKKFAASVLLLALVCCRVAWAQTIPDQIDAILARSAVAGNTWSILIQNDTGTVTYYQKNPNTGLAPASNTKLFTCSTAFAVLGTNHMFESRIYFNGPFTNGTLTGDLNLVCEHDITWNDDTLGSARKGLDFISTKLKALGLQHITGNVQIYGVCIYNHADTDDTRDTQNQAGYNLEGATNFVASLLAQGITIDGGALGQTGFSPPGSLYYTYESTNMTYGGKPLRLDVACIPLAKNSENPMADALLRHIGYKISGTDSFSAGAKQVFTFLKNTVGMSTNGMVMQDGSGLSHSDAFTAQETVTLTRYMLNNYPSWSTILPIGCVDGTLGGRFCSTAGSGQVHAKTGSLSISIALSGYIINPNDSRRYLFSFIANQSAIDQTNTRQAIDDAVVLLGARGVPTSPQIISVTNGGNNTLTVTWSDEKFVRTGYRLYTSTNGISFDPPVTLATNVQSYTATNLLTGVKKYFRVSVVGSGGESPPSRTYGAQSATEHSRVLLVDGYDRWQFQTTDNPGASNHIFCAITGQNISGPPFDTVHHNAIITGAISLTNYLAVVWLLGEESTQDETFSSTEQGIVTSYVNAGGDLFLSGAEIGWDLDRGSGPTTADRNFYHNQLRAVFANDDANTYSFSPSANSIFSGNAASGFDNGTFGTYNVAFPDVLTPTNGSVSAISYVGGTGGAAAVVYDGTNGMGKIVNFGFPFETITNSVARDAYMSDILRYFGVLDPPRALPPLIAPAQNQLILNWTASSGLKYRVQYRTDLMLGSWTDLTPDVTAGGTMASFTNSLSGPQKFYRILLVN